MKLLFSAISFFAIISLTSCATPDIGRQYEFLESNSKVINNAGYLKIFSYNYKERGSAWDDPVYNVYKGYTIYSLNGEFIMDVKKSFYEPGVIKLKEGKYIVIAELHKNIINSFTVTIQKGKILEIDKSMIENPFALK